MQHELEKLIENCKKGDPEAFNELLMRYSDRFYAYFYRLTGRADLSEELLSDLFIRLVRKIKTFETGSFEKWIFAVASNLFRDYLRRHYRQKRLLTEKAEILRQLDPETAEIITLRYYSELSFKELAELRGEPIGTTLSKVHRGIKKLRQIMDEL